MNIGDRLRAEVRELESRESHDLDDDYRRFLQAYAQWQKDPRYQAQAVARAEGPQLGIAAYTLGIHFTAQDKFAQARRWLRIAARYDVGDAALRLAHLYELEGLDQAQSPAREEPVGAENRALARIWYGQARRAGYTTGEEQPSIDLDLEHCCTAVTELAAREKSERIVAAAKAEAEALVRRARSDVQGIVDDARAEVNRLALQRQIIMERLLQIRATLSGYANPVSRPPTPEEPPRRFFRRRARPREDVVEYAIPEELEHELTLCAQILLAILLHDEPVSRPMIAAVIKELAQQSTGVAVERLDSHRPTRPRPGRFSQAWAVNG
jgi:hypothetical protein